MNKFLFDVYRVSLAEAKELNYQHGCPDCDKHLKLAELFDLDLMWQSETKDFVGVCFK